MSEKNEGKLWNNNREGRLALADVKLQKLQ